MVSCPCMRRRSGFVHAFREDGSGCGMNSSQCEISKTVKERLVEPPANPLADPGLRSGEGAQTSVRIKEGRLGMLL